MAPRLRFLSPMTNQTNFPAGFTPVRVRKRRHPAAVARIISAGGSATLTFVFVAFMAASAKATPTKAFASSGLPVPASVAPDGPTVVIIKQRYIQAATTTTAAALFPLPQTGDDNGGVGQVVVPNQPAGTQPSVAVGTAVAPSTPQPTAAQPTAAQPPPPAPPTVPQPVGTTGGSAPQP